MKIAVMGSGGVGGYFGARLAQAGCDVAFIARGAHLAAMREHGLKVESQLGDIHLPKVRVTDDPGTLEPVDLVLFSVKLWDTEAAAGSIKPLFGPDTGIVSFQNGVQKDDILRRGFGDKAVMGGVGYIAAEIARARRDQAHRHHATTGLRRIRRQALGARRGLARCVQARRYQCRTQRRHPPRNLGKVCVSWSACPATTTTMRVPIGPIRANPQTRAFLFDIMQEVVAVGRAHGVALAEDYAEKRLAFCDGLPADMTSSMHHDLEAASRSSWRG